MAPNRKGNKKGNDDWESELGESVDPRAAATQETNDAEANALNGNPDDERARGGGLLAAIQKNRSKKQKKGLVIADSLDGGSGAELDGIDDAGTIGQIDLTKKAPEEASTDDLFATGPVKGKGSKDGKQGRGKEEDKRGDDEDENDDSNKMKTKKEKEKEKKEKEKQRKKEQATKRKTPGPGGGAKPEAPKAIQETKPVEPAAVPDPSKGKKLPPALAALRKQQEALRRQQEEQERLEAEQRARIEEEERLAAEEEKKQAEARARRREKEKEKREQLKKEGKLLTRAQKEAKERNELRMKQMLAAGGKVAGLEGTGEKKRPVYDNKKKKGMKKFGEATGKEDEKGPTEDESQELVADAEVSSVQADDTTEAATQGDNDTANDRIDGLEDWEAEADAQDNVKDSWDAPSDEDDQKSGAKPTNGRSVDGQSEAAEVHLSTGTNGVKSRSSHQNAVAAPSKASQNKAEHQDSDSGSDESLEDEVTTATQRAAAQKKAEAAARRKQQHEEALAARSKDNLRSPICCILGHVDTGKTKLLDKIRQTNVQEGEAGGITQQIGATYFPVDALRTKTQVVNKDGAFDFKVPGLLVIDTPGHESFSNLRSRGSSLCNIAILVVDIMHGLEPQTLESMKLLRDRKTPFIVALNKIDRLYNWKKIDNNGFQDSLAIQSKAVQGEFRDRLEKTKLAFAEQGFNAELYYENEDMRRNVSLVPTSAYTGEGIPDMLKLLVSLTQERMTNKLMYLSEVECTVLEVKVIEGLGTTIDVVLSNGILREGDRIVLCGVQGAIATNIRALLTPAPLKELRLKSQYVHNQEVKASLGVKIAANDLDHAIAGSRLLVVGPGDDEEELEDDVMSDIENLLGKVSKTGRGVSVQASTLGSLEALLEFLKVSKIPVANISIGPVYKRDVMSAGIMLEKAKEYAVMLCFDVKVDKEAQAYADDVGVKIFTADIIYHLFDDFTKHMAQLVQQKKEESKLLAVFPCVLNPVAVFNKKDPIVVGIDVTEGSLRLLTPIAAVKTNPVTGVKEIIALGRVQSIERDHKQIPICKKGQPSVAVKIEGPNQPLYGRQLEEKDVLYSLISRQSIDTLKEYYRSEVSNDEWLLIKKLKSLFDVP